MFIIQFLLIVFVIAFATVAFVIWRTWRKVHKAVDQFNQQFGGDAQAQQRQTSQEQQRTTTTDSGETIIDTRSQKQVNQKIFSKDEGEYVDYEVKE